MGLHPGGVRARSARAWAGARFYTQASSLAFRTLNPFENFTDAGVGLGRNFADMDQLTLPVSVPVADRWLVDARADPAAPGRGRDQRSLSRRPPAELAQIPQLFIGVVERTSARRSGLSGRQGPLDLTANAGLHHVVNGEHEEGRTVNRFEGRLQATLGLSREGVLR